MPKMRIISGSAKGKKLLGPPQIKLDIRPMMEMVREALFDILTSKIADTEVLDLYAGTGAIGIEALSRGAEKATFIDIKRKCCGIVKKNLEITGFIDAGNVICSRASEFIKGTGRQFDIIFFDPPYAEFDLNILDESAKLLKKGGIIVASSRKELDYTGKLANLSLVSERKYGETKLAFLIRKSAK